MTSSVLVQDKTQLDIIPDEVNMNGEGPRYRHFQVSFRRHGVVDENAPIRSSPYKDSLRSDTTTTLSKVILLARALAKLLSFEIFVD